MSHQHAALEDTVYFWFGANDTSGSGNDGASAIFDVRLAGAAAGAIPTLSGSATLLTHANYPAGAYEVAVAATAGNGFAADGIYAVFCTLLVDSQNPTGFVGSFELAPVIADIKEVNSNAQRAEDLAEIAKVFIANTSEPLTDFVANDSLYAKLIAVDGTVEDYDDNTDSLEAIRNRGDAAWTSATGFSTHSAASVWAVGTRALTDKAGFSLAADQSGVTIGTVNSATCVAGTAAFFQDFFTVDSGEVSGAEVSGSAILEITKVVWDRVLSGATHNIGSSAGRRLRTLQDFGVYEGGAVWVDTVNGTGGTTDFENGTVSNPSNTIANARLIADSVGLVAFHIASGSSITLAEEFDSFEFIGEGWTLALGGQSISGAVIHGASTSGIGTGANRISFEHCMFGNVTLPAVMVRESGLSATFTASAAANYFFDRCHSMVAGTGAPVFDFGAAVGNSSINFRNYSGGIQFENMGDTGTDTASLEGNGQFVEGTCTGGTVAIRGNFTTSGVTNLTLSEDARFDIAQATRTGYDGGAVWIDTNASNTNTVSFMDGTADNPVSTLAAATTIAGNVNIKEFRLVPGSSITLAQAYDSYTFNACHSTVALGGQSINNAVIRGAVVTGNDDGSNANHVQYFDCVIGGNTLGQFVLTRCYLTAAALTLAQAGTYYMHQCFSRVAGTSTPTIDFGSGLNASNINVRDYSGGIEIENMGKGTGNYNMSLEGNGQLVINANSTADGGGVSTIAIRGNFTVTDNASEAVTLSDDARFDVDQINAEVDTALSDAEDAIADAILIRGVSNVQDTADTTSLAAIILAILESSVSGATWTIRKTGGATFVTKTVTTDENADPITGVT